LYLCLYLYLSLRSRTLLSRLLGSLRYSLFQTFWVRRFFLPIWPCLEKPSRHLRTKTVCETRPCASPRETVRLPSDRKCGWLRKRLREGSRRAQSVSRFRGGHRTSSVGPRDRRHLCAKPSRCKWTRRNRARERM